MGEMVIELAFKNTNFSNNSDTTTAITKKLDHKKNRLLWLPISLYTVIYMNMLRLYTIYKSYF